LTVVSVHIAIINWLRC